MRNQVRQSQCSKFPNTLCSRNSKVLGTVMMGTIKSFIKDHPGMKVTLGDTQVALSRVYDELSRRTVFCRVLEQRQKMSALAS